MVNNDPVVRAPNAIRWGAVFSGTLIGVATFVLGTALWVALGVTYSGSTWNTSLDWWTAGTAIFAMFLGGLLAGALSGSRGIGAGLANGATVWSLVVIAGLVVGTPVGFRVADLNANATGVATAVPSATLWAVFWAILIGLGSAVLGGVLGGMLPWARRDEVVAAYPAAEREPVLDRERATH